MDNVTTEILSFFRSLSPAGFDEKKIVASQDLYRDGILDSLSTLTLVHFLETKFDIRFGPFLVTRKNFSALDSIHSLVARVQNKEA